MEKIDLNESKRISRILSGMEPKPNRFEAKLAAIKLKISNADQDPGLERKSCLFFFKSKFYHVKGKVNKIVEADVKSLLEEHQDTQVYYLCSDKVCPMPAALMGKTKKAVKVKDDAGAAEFMSEKSGIKVTINDL
jgi:hypothetical protein